MEDVASLSYQKFNFDSSSVKIKITEAEIETSGEPLADAQSQSQNKTAKAKMKNQIWKKIIGKLSRVEWILFYYLLQVIFGVVLLGLLAFDFGQHLQERGRVALQQEDPKWEGRHFENSWDGFTSWFADGMKELSKGISTLNTTTFITKTRTTITSFNVNEENQGQNLRFETQRTVCKCGGWENKCECTEIPPNLNKKAR